MGLRQQRLIALLALLGPSTRNSCANTLWPVSSEDKASLSLRACLFKINHALPGLLQVWGDSISLENDVWVDVHALRRWLVDAAEGRQAERGAEPADGRAELLPGWYDDWVIFEQERLNQQRLLSLEAIAKTKLEVGDFGHAEQAATAALGIEPLRETACVLLVRALLGAGNRALALQTFERFRALLSEELAIEPSVELAELVGVRPVAAKSFASPPSRTLGIAPLPAAGPRRGRVEARATVQPRSGVAPWGTGRC